MPNGPDALPLLDDSPDAAPPDTPAGEMFYEVDGTREDADLHEEMLSGVDPDYLAGQYVQAYAEMVAQGADPQVARELLGLPDGVEVAPLA